jgi:hypothetical protein
MSESTYQPGDDGNDLDDDVIDLDQAFGDDEVDEVVYGTGYSPPEKPLGMTRFGTTVAEEEEGESLDQRLAQEEPDPNLAADLGADPDENIDTVDNTRVEDQDVRYSEAGEGRAGRLVDPDEGFGEDREKDLLGTDVGIDEGAASAEEAAVHIIE